MILCCAISYAYIVVIDFISKLASVNIEQSAMIYSGFVLSILVPFILYFICKSSWFSWILLHSLHRTVNHDDIFKDLFDFKNGTNLNIHLKNTNYHIVGSYDMHNISQNPGWISLTHYKIFKDEKEINTHSLDFVKLDDLTITINFNEIDFIEIMK